jgi:hypothetical protein
MPATAEQEWEYWDKQATDLRRSQLKTVQTSATKWSTLLTALLGVFGTVAFAGGLSSLDDLEPPWAGVAKSMTTIAAGLAIVAIVCLSYAAGGLRLTAVSALSGPLLKRRNTDLAGSSLALLDLGRLCAVLAGLAVLAGSFMVLWAPTSEPRASRVIARFDDVSYCGRPTKAPIDNDLLIGGRKLSEATEIISVAACP